MIKQIHKKHRKITQNDKHKIKQQKPLTFIKLLFKLGVTRFSARAAAPFDIDPEPDSEQYICNRTCI